MFGSHGEVRRATNGFASKQAHLLGAERDVFRKVVIH